MASRRLPPLLAAVGLLLSLTPGAAAQEASTEGILTRVRTAARHGEPPQVARLVGWDAEGPQLAGGAAPADWMRLSFPLAEARRPAPEADETWVLELADGLQVHGRPRGGSPDRLDWAVGRGADLLLVPFDLLGVRGFGRSGLPPRLGELEQDLLVLRTDLGLDRRRGWLEEIGPDGVRFAVDDRVEEHPWERIEALRLLEEESLIPVADNQVIVRLQNGAFLPFQPQTLADGAWQGELPWGGSLAIDAEQVLEFERVGGPFVELGLVAPQEQDYPPAEVLDWSPRLHQSVSGRELRVADRAFPRGFGVRAPTTLGWRVEPGLLTVACGVDAEVAGHRQPAPLRFQVLLDDEVLAETGALTRDAGLAELRVPVPRPGLLRLRCLSEGPAAASGRHGDWIAPRYWPSDGAP